MVDMSGHRVSELSLSYDTSEVRARCNCFREAFFYKAVLPDLSRSPICQVSGGSAPKSGKSYLAAQWPPPGATSPPPFPVPPMPTVQIPQSASALQAMSTRTSRRSGENKGENPAGNIEANKSLGPRMPTTGKKGRSRCNFTAYQRQLLEKFFYDHLDHPYAGRRDLEALEIATLLSKRQIRVFMTNARMRKFASLKQRTRCRVRNSAKGDEDEALDDSDSGANEVSNEECDAGEELSSSSVVL
jgi:hypothetical protein